MRGGGGGGVSDKIEFVIVNYKVATIPFLISSYIIMLDYKKKCIVRSKKDLAVLKLFRLKAHKEI